VRSQEYLVIILTLEIKISENSAFLLLHDALKSISPDFCEIKRWLFLSKFWIHGIFTVDMLWPRLSTEIYFVSDQETIGSDRCFQICCCLQPNLCSNSK